MEVPEVAEVDARWTASDSSVVLSSAPQFSLVET